MVRGIFEGKILFEESAAEEDSVKWSDDFLFSPLSQPTRVPPEDPEGFFAQYYSGGGGGGERSSVD